MVLVSYAAYAVAFLGNALISGGWNGGPGQLWVAYLAPLAFLIVCLLPLRSPRSHSWALAWTGVLASLYLFEILIMPNLESLKVRNRARGAEEQGVSFDQRSLQMVVDDLRAEGQKAVPMEVYSTDLSFANGQKVVPLAGFSNVRTVGGNETGVRMTYMADEHGFDNPGGLYQRGKVDVVLIGDSFAQGCSVANSESIAGNLRQTYSGVLNLGFAGRGPLGNLATMREYALPLKPKTIFWLHYEGNDLTDLRRELETTLVGYREPDYSLGLADRQAELEEVMTRVSGSGRLGVERASKRRRVTAILKLSGTREWLSTVIDDMLAPCRAAEQDRVLLPDLIDLIDLGAESAEMDQSKLVFVYLPCWLRYGRPKQWAKADQRDELIDALRQRNIPVIDMCPVFLDSGDPLGLFPYRRKGHYNAEGYARVASRLDAYLREAASE